jgi:putative acetyltransferase
MKKTKQENITIRRGQLNDLPAIQNLFVETIKSVCIADYNEEQIKVWVSSVHNKPRWDDIMSNQVILIAQIDNKIVGFSSLKNGNYIDLLYVHKDYQGQGIAFKLYIVIEKQAIQFNQKDLISDVSKTAKPFFEKIGFVVVKEQNVLRQNIELTNFKMAKQL